MDLALTAEQEMLKSAVSRFIQQEYPKETLLEMAETGEVAPSQPWRRLVETGWLGITVPEEYGGEGGSFTDAGVLFEELGRGPVPGPHISSSVMGTFAILEGGTEEQKREWLPRLARGERSLVLAVTEADYSWWEEDVHLTAQPSGDGFQLNGTKVYVMDANSATHLLCAVRSEDGTKVGLVIVSADAPGVAIRSLPGFNWHLSEIKLENVNVAGPEVLGGSLDGGWDALQRVHRQDHSHIGRLSNRGQSDGL